MEQQSANEVPNLFVQDGAPETAPEAVEEKAPEQTEQERLAAKFAEAAKRNQALRAKQREIKAPLKEKESEIESLKSELARLKRYEEVKDPMELLKMREFSYDDVIARSLNPEQYEEKEQFSSLKEEIESLKKQIQEEKESAKKAEEEKIAKNAEEGKKQYIEHLKTFTEKNVEKYELIHSLEMHDEVFETIAETMARTGKLLSDEEAADMVEKALEEIYLDRLSKINKLKNKITVSKDGDQKENLFKQPATLTNQLTPQTTAKKEKLSDEELLKRAASVIRWENN